MEKYGALADLIDKAPPQALKVTYHELEVNLGNELTPTQVKDIPIVHWNPDDEGAYYLLCMTDPDAASHVKEVRHWLVGNIPGNKLNEGETWTEYVGSGPPKDTGLHRYVFLVYKQPGKISYEEPCDQKRTRESRLNFSIRKFVEKYNLGHPIAANFYRAQYDDYVPILHAQFRNP